MPIVKKNLLNILFVVCAINLFAQTNVDVSDQNSLLEPVSETVRAVSIFENEEPLDLTLKYDITSFIRKKAKGEYLDAELYVHINDTDSISKNIRLKARGNFRRGHCFFPPIYLNFKTDPITESDLAEIKKIKMVTHCSTAKSYRAYILKEYLAYRILNILTENSFRVKLINIKYIDTGKRQRNYQQMGFLIEPLELLAKRTNTVEINPKIILGKNIVEEDIDVVALFNYMIANTDWRAKGGHNLKYIKSLEHLTSQVIPVSYDFDHAGFIGASYATPQDWTSIKGIYEREYLGYCRDNDESYLKAIQLFVDKKEEIFSEINTFEYLEEKQRIILIKFLKKFYDLAEQPEFFVKTLNRECRSIDF